MYNGLLISTKDNQMNKHIVVVIVCALATFVLMGCTVLITEPQSCRTVVMVKYEDQGTVKYVPEERIVDCKVQE